MRPRFADHPDTALFGGRASQTLQKLLDRFFVILKRVTHRKMALVLAGDRIPIDDVRLVRFLEMADRHRTSPRSGVGWRVEERVVAAHAVVELTDGFGGRQRKE